MNEFDSDKFKIIVKSKFSTYDEYVEHLNDVFRLDKKLNTVQKWGQKSSSNVPTAKELPIVAESLGIEIIDLYTQADNSRSKITKEEITNNPEKYSDAVNSSFFSTLPPDTKTVVESFLLLTEEQQEHVLAEMKALAHENMKV